MSRVKGGVVFVRATDTIQLAFLPMAIRAVLRRGRIFRAKGKLVIFYCNVRFLSLVIVVGFSLRADDLMSWNQQPSSVYQRARPYKRGVRDRYSWRVLSSSHQSKSSL